MVCSDTDVTSVLLKGQNKFSVKTISLLII